MNLHEAPGMPTKQIPLNFDQETAEEKLARLKVEYRQKFGQDASVMKLDLSGMEDVLKDENSIKAHTDAINAIWQQNLAENQDERRKPGYR